MIEVHPDSSPLFPPRRRPSVRVRTAWLLAALLMPCPVSFADDEAEGDVVEFAFTGPEIFPIDAGVSFLRHGDIDGDGLTDLVIANNQRSKINFLLNRTGSTNRLEKTSVERELNELPPDARFEMDSVTSEKRVSALEVADFNDDGRVDLAYYGEPKELVAQFNNGERGWSLPKRWSISDGQTSPNALTSGDLNGDGLTDLVLLGEDKLYVLRQDKETGLGEPEVMPFTGQVRAVQIVDINGDELQDLLLVNWQSANPFQFRLQDRDGRFGAETFFEFPAIHSYWLDDLDGDQRPEMITIAMQSGRAQIGNFQRKESTLIKGDFREGQFSVVPVQRTGKSARGQAWGDIDGDGREDLVIAEPESGQLTVFRQLPSGGLDSPRTFPAPAGISDIAIADWDDKGNAEVFVLSADERQIGVTRMEENDRIGFPNALPIDGRPLKMAVGSLREDRPPVLAALVDKDGARSLKLYAAEGLQSEHKLKEEFRGMPSSMMFHDLNQDGLNDIAILVPYERMLLLVQKEDGGFDETELSPPGGNTEQPWMSAADVDGDGKSELLLAQKNFLRAVYLERENDLWSFKVKDQINGSSSRSKISGVTTIRNGDADQDSLFLLDTGEKVLSLAERDDSGVWQIVRNLQLPLINFQGLRAVRLGGESANAIAMEGINQIAWMRLDGDVWSLDQLDGYETPVNNGRLNDVISGDLNQDGRKELLFLETQQHYVDLVMFTAADKLLPVNRWKVFEERTFRGGMNFGEPREALIADLTGDDLNDLVLLVHDRVLLYPQE